MWADYNNVIMSIDAYSCVEEFSIRLSDVIPYDLAVLDIEMRNMTGVDLAGYIRKNDKNMQIIVITDLEEHAEVSARQYLVKPHKPDKFIAVLDKAYFLYKKSESEFFIARRDGQVYRIPYMEIMYMEKCAHYFEMHTVSMGQFRIKKTVKAMLAELDNKLFISCHRSTIINIAHVAGVVHNEAKLEYSDKKIAISLSHIQAVTKLFVEYQQQKPFWA